MRQGLQPLVDLGTHLGAAVLGVTHLTKGTAGRDPLERVTGSLAYAALARLVWLAARQPAEGDTPERRVLMRAKSNIGPDGDGFEYALVNGELSELQLPRLAWPDMAQPACLAMKSRIRRAISSVLSSSAK